jgi:chromosome partitioning protein
VTYLGVVGASPELAGSEVELSGNLRRDDLRRVLRPLSDQHPLIIVDTPPSLSLITVNALVAADRLIIPVQCEYFALEGLGQLLRTLERVKRSLNPDLSVLGLVRTMFDARLGLSSQVSHELETHFAELLFDTVIPRNVRLAEAPSHGQPVALYDRRSPGADAYRRLAVEVLQRTGLSPQQGPVSLRSRNA